MAAWAFFAKADTVLIRFVKDSIRRAPRRKALIILAVALGSAVATSMLGVMLSIGDKVNRESRAVGANIVVTARAASVTGGAGGIQAKAAGSANYLAEADVLKIKHIFWGLNITGFSPSLQAQDGGRAVQGVWFTHSYTAPAGGIETTGIRAVNPVWDVRGTWARDKVDECMVGEGLARRVDRKEGGVITVFGVPFRIAGIISSGEEADDRIFIPLARLQELTHRPGLIDRIDVAALTKPEDEFARRNPNTMNEVERERWNCTNYVVSIAHQIEQAIPGTEARPVRRVADSEGKILDKIGGLMAFITLAALLSAGLTVWSLTATTMIERRGEVAIMQAIGGAPWLVASLLAVEIALIGAAGGFIGAFSGVWLSKFVGQSVFHDAVEISPILPFLIVIAAILIALAGAAQPLRHALRLEPAAILREGV
ncbi:MAG: ABC transporter permease [Acidobacteriota bacterium]|nr:ABC transporter permease [Acidobacteriota bacterium]